MNKVSIQAPTTVPAAILRFCAAAAGALLISFMGCELVNNPPSIDIQIEDDTPLTGSSQTFTAVVEDLDEDVVSVSWSATDGVFNKTTGEVVKWTAPADIGPVLVTAVADDRKAGGTDTATVALSVVNSAPGITEFSSSSPYVTLGNSVTLTCEALDPDGEDITFKFYTFPPDVGTMNPAGPQETNTATWTAPSDPNEAQIYDLIVEVSDIPQGYYSLDTLQVLVFSEYGTMWIVESGVNPRVSKYTPRREEVFSAAYSFQKPVAVANNIDEFYGCYVADQDAGQIIKLDEQGQQVSSFAGITSIPSVTDLAIHRETRTLWAISVSDDEPRRLTVIDTYTESVIKQVKGLSHPAAITINQTAGDVWIADGTGANSRIIQINIVDFLADPPDSLSSLNAAILEGSFNSPSSLTVRNAKKAPVYVADTNDNEIEYLKYNDSNGEYEPYDYPISLPPGTNPLKVEITEENGQVWVLGLDKGIQYFTEIDTSLKEPIDSYPFADPHAMAVDQGTRSVWIGDNGTNQVVEITSAGEQGIDISGFSFIEDIVINK
ncbi:MAG: hypothetical protein JSU77_07825 [Fidelibacterota bacterium]|nr:MAG: hypothetical protein JSU77_07825 [Candidatus Neomarinimicrobiota bacterium]